MNDAQRYPAQVFYSDDDKGFIAVATDLPGCSAFGETQEEAVAELRDAIDAWQLAAKSAGNPIPEPSKPQLDDLPSGKILLRLPRTLHAQLIERARYENVSLNQHLVFVLTASTSFAVARSATVEHGDLYWSRSLSAVSLATCNYSPNSGSGVVVIGAGGHGSGARWFESSGKTYAVPKLIDYRQREASHG